MINELLWFLLMITSFIIVILAYRFFGKAGLFAWMAVAIIIANIQVMKTIPFFGLVTALGNIIYGTTFLVTDILNENHGKKEARKAVWIGFFTLIAVTIIMQICLKFVPHETDFSQESLQTIFGILPRIAFASLTAYVVAQNHDVWLYNRIRRAFPQYRLLWLRNNLSTMISQFIDNIIFTVIAFIGIFSLEIMFQIFITSYFMKWITAACDTPFLYIAKLIKRD